MTFHKVDIFTKKIRTLGQFKYGKWAKRYGLMYGRILVNLG